QAFRYQGSAKEKRKGKEARQGRRKNGRSRSRPSETRRRGQGQHKSAAHGLAKSQPREKSQGQEIVCKIRAKAIPRDEFALLRASCGKQVALPLHGIGMTKAFAHR